MKKISIIHYNTLFFFSRRRNSTSGIETYPKQDSRQHQSRSPKGNNHAQPQKRRIQPQSMEQSQAMNIEQDISNKKIRFDHHGSKAVNQQKREDSKNTKSKTKTQDRLKKFRDSSLDDANEIISNSNVIGTGLLNPNYRPKRVNISYFQHLNFLSTHVFP